MKRVVALALLIGAAGWSAGVRAAHQRTASDGAVHSVVVRNWVPKESKGMSGGTELQHTRQLADGRTQSTIIPGTDDLAMDVEPDLDLDPATGAPILAWARNEGSGYEIFVSRYLGGSWTSPLRLLQGGANKRAPRVQVGNSWIHITWQEEDALDGACLVRAVLEPETLEIVFGPQVLPRPDLEPIPLGGETKFAGSKEPPVDLLYVAAAGISAVPGEPGMVWLWGVRDEPVPIDFLQNFVLPPHLREVRGLEPRRAHGRFVLTFHDDTRFFYTMHRNGRWTDLRVILLDDLTGAPDAMLQVADMIFKELGAVATE